MTDIDGPCEVPSCLDPVGTDDGGHGTHVAGTIGAAANGFGVSGVAPNVSLVELKGGQDSGYFFLEPVVNALIYAGRHGIDVVNMSFYVDPWLYNCTANPADSPAAQAEQRTIIKAMNRALTFAHFKGVTLVAALGNNHEDLGAPRTDTTSPDYPAGTAYPRPIDNDTCWDLPTEGPHVIGVSALGPSGKKADYSNYGTEQISVAAPGGCVPGRLRHADLPTPTPTRSSPTYPLKVLQEEGRVDADGNIAPGGETLVFKECKANGECGYYTYLQGTSMASPHAAGVAALIVSRYGKTTPRTAALRLEPGPGRSASCTARRPSTPARTPPLSSLHQRGPAGRVRRVLRGRHQFNGFYGYGIVDAYAAVTAHPWWH